jgi:membrane protein YdbS with pleckstrin-like domain
MSQDQPSQESPQQPAPEEHPHKPADDREELYFQGSPELRGEIGRLILAGLTALALAAIPILFWIFKWTYFPVWAAAILWLAAILIVGFPILVTRTTRYRISNYRIDFERGILTKRIDTLELWHVEDIQFQQSLLNRLLGVGTITIISHDETTPRLCMEGLPNPRPLFESLKQRVIAVKRQRGVIKMDIG